MTANTGTPKPPPTTGLDPSTAVTKAAPRMIRRITIQFGNGNEATIDVGAEETMKNFESGIEGITFTEPFVAATADAQGSK